MLAIENQQIPPILKAIGFMLAVHILQCIDHPVMSNGVRIPKSLRNGQVLHVYVLYRALAILLFD